MYLDLDTKINLLLITERSPVIIISEQIMRARAIKRCQIFGNAGFARKIIEINAAAIDTSLMK